MMYLCSVINNKSAGDTINTTDKKMRTEKGMKLFTLKGIGKVKADAISAALNFLEEKQIPVAPRSWCGHWDGIQWDSKEVFMHPSDVKNNIETLKDHFNVEVVEN